MALRGIRKLGNSLLKHYLDRAQHNHSSGFLMKDGERKQMQEKKKKLLKQKSERNSKDYLFF